MRMKILIAVVMVCILKKDVSAGSPGLGPPKSSAAASITCGKRPMMDNPFGAAGSRILGGHDAIPGSWPWMVSLQVPVDLQGNFSHVYGGFLISPWWVLTGAHNFIQMGSLYLKWRLVLGSHQHSKMGAEIEIRKIAKKIEHKEYNPDTEEYDIALLKMDRSVSYSDYIQPACLPRKDTVIEHLTECYISGWGYIKEREGEMSDILQEAQVELIDVKKCNSTRWYKGEVKKYNICAGFEKGGVDTCIGDSGGPLMCRKPETKLYTVVGVASWGSGCGRARSPGVYTSTQFFLEWINLNTAM